jgi:hypothetical protein
VISFDVDSVLSEIESEPEVTAISNESAWPTLSHPRVAEVCPMFEEARFLGGCCPKRMPGKDAIAKITQTIPHPRIENAEEENAALRGEVANM